MVNHYELFGWKENPALSDDRDKTKFIAKTKKEVVGLIKTMLDNMNCGFIEVYRVD